MITLSCTIHIHLKWHANDMQRRRGDAQFINMLSSKDVWMSLHNEPRIRETNEMADMCVSLHKGTLTQETPLVVMKVER